MSGSTGEGQVIEVLSIGDELLDGLVQEANGLFLAETLARRGLSVSRHTLVRDDAPDIVAALRGVRSRGASACVVSGGLGPTDDDRTAAAAATAFGVEIVRRSDWVEHLESRYAARGRTLRENNRKQADLPDGAQLLWNDLGTAPGFRFSVDHCDYYFLPGVPREYRPMCRDAVVPALVDRAPAPTVTAAVIRTFGLPESEVDQRLAGVSEETGAWMGFRASFPEVHVRLRGAPREVLKASSIVRQRLAPAVYGEGDDTFPGAVVAALRSARSTLAVAESCTGGLVGKLLTDAPGASAAFLGGALVYSNELKTRFAGVPKPLLEEHGAVSEPVAKSLATGIQGRTDATYGLGITGVAGPGGGGEDKPVGLVWLAVAGPEGVKSRRIQFPGDRAQIRRLSAFAGLEMVRRRVA